MSVYIFIVYVFYRISGNLGTKIFLRISSLSKTEMKPSVRGQRKGYSSLKEELTALPVF